MPLIEYIDITEVDLKDGVTWHASGTDHCRVEPKGILPVAGTRQHLTTAAAPPRNAVP